MPKLQILFDLTSLFLGFIFGSFVNVIVHRLPQNISIIKPRSFCPECNKIIPWYENIPIFSWFFLKGKCSGCNLPIPVRYPLIETFTGILFFISYKCTLYNIGIDNYLFNLLANWAIILILFPLSIIDYYYLWIPNSIIKIGILFGFFISIFLSIINNQNLFLNIFESLISGIFGFLIIILIMKFGEIIFKKPSMGLGDAKLAGMIGFWIGFPGVIISIWLSFIISGLFVILGLATKIIKKGQLIPFGPFLSITGFLIWLYGEDIFLRIIFQ